MRLLQVMRINQIIACLTNRYSPSVYDGPDTGETAVSKTTSLPYPWGDDVLLWGDRKHTHTPHNVSDDWWECTVTWPLWETLGCFLEN